MSKPKRTKDPHEGLTLLKANHRDYPVDPAQAPLETFPNPNPGRDYEITFDCPEFTALCPLTGQPSTQG